MRKLLFAAMAAGTLAAGTLVAVPASAQVDVGVGPRGVDVGVGPRHDGWGHRHWRDRDTYGSGDCRVVRERIVTPSGRVIFRSRRDCD